MINQYRKLLRDTTLQDLPSDGPQFVFNTTNMATGANFRFQKQYSGDYRIGLVSRPELNSFSLAKVVAASAASPPFLSPVIFEMSPDAFERTKGADLYDNVSRRTKIVCTDGGVYDNMGVEPIWKRYRTLLVFDAGGSPTLSIGRSFPWIGQLIRPYNLTTEQDRDLRRRILYEAFESGRRTGAYWYIPMTLDRFELKDAMPVDPCWPNELASVDTRLTKFSKDTQYRLINWGYALTDTAVRRWYQNSTKPTKWPFEKYSLGQSSCVCEPAPS